MRDAIWCALARPDIAGANVENDVPMAFTEQALGNNRNATGGEQRARGATIVLADLHAVALAMQWKHIAAAEYLGFALCLRYIAQGQFMQHEPQRFIGVASVRWYGLGAPA